MWLLWLCGAFSKSEYLLLKDKENERCFNRDGLIVAGNYEVVASKYANFIIQIKKHSTKTTNN